MRACILAAFVCVLVAVLPVGAQVKVTGAEGGSLSALKGSQTLVTVVLKDSGARDANLKVLDYNGTAVNFLNEANDVIPYLITDIDTIEVQGGVIEKAALKLDQSRALRPEEQLIYDRAISRTQEIYNESAANQEVKIQAATLLAGASKQEAINYLLELAQSNNINAQLSAGLGLYVSGVELPADSPVSLTGLVKKGMESGNRQARAQGAQLAGLIGDKTATSSLLDLLQDRNPTQAGPAAIALGRLGVRESVPQLLGMIEARTEDKGDAARVALVKLGGPEVIEQMKIQLTNAQGFGKFRIARVLYELEDETGKKEMQHFFRDVYLLAVEAAKLLAADGDFDAMGDLQGRLNERMDESDEGLIAYTDMAVALLKGGDNTAQAVLQQVLRKESVKARIAVCQGVADTGNRRLMPLVQSSMESRDLPLAVEACAAVLALGQPELRTRLLAKREG